MAMEETWRQKSRDYFRWWLLLYIEIFVGESILGGLLVYWLLARLTLLVLFAICILVFMNLVYLGFAAYDLERLRALCRSEHVFRLHNRLVCASSATGVKSVYALYAMFSAERRFGSLQVWRETGFVADSFPDFDAFDNFASEFIACLDDALATTDPQPLLQESQNLLRRYNSEYIPIIRKHTVCPAISV